MPMTADDVMLKLRTHVAMLVGVEAAQVATDRPLHLLGLDSMGFVDLLVFIEKQFGLSLMSSGLAHEDFASLSVLAQRIVQASQK
jgi:acyl carrier protein